MIGYHALSADGTPVRYLADGSGPPLVLVPGTLTPPGAYRSFVASLAGRWRCHVLVRRGYAGSLTGPGPSRFAGQVADLVAVLDAIGEPAVVVGHSFGGVIALAAAASAAQRGSATAQAGQHESVADRATEHGAATEHGSVGAQATAAWAAWQESASAGRGSIARLALYEPPLGQLGGRLAGTLRECRRLLADGDAVGAVRAAFRDSAPVPGRPDGPPAEIAARLTREIPGLLSDLECVTAMTGADPGWGRVNVPVLLVEGSATGSGFRDDVEAAARLLPGAERRVLAGQAHALTDPGALALMVDDWVESDVAV